MMMVQQSLCHLPCWYAYQSAAIADFTSEQAIRCLIKTTNALHVIGAQSPILHKR